MTWLMAWSWDQFNSQITAANRQPLVESDCWRDQFNSMKDRIALLVVF